MLTPLVNDSIRRRVTLGATVELGHADVHQNDIGIGAGDDLDRFDAISCFTDHSDIIISIQYRSQSFSSDFMIVYDYDANCFLITLAHELPP